MLHHSKNFGKDRWVHEIIQLNPTNFERKFKGNFVKEISVKISKSKSEKKRGLFLKWKH